MVNVLGKRGWVIWLLMIVGYNFLEAHKPTEIEEEEYPEYEEEEKRTEKEAGGYLMPFAAGAALATGIAKSFKSSEPIEAAPKYTTLDKERERSIATSPSRAKKGHVRVGTSMPGWEEEGVTPIRIDSEEILPLKVIDREKKEADQLITEAMRMITEVTEGVHGKRIKSIFSLKDTKEKKLQRKKIEKAKKGVPALIHYIDAESKEILYQVEEGKGSKGKEVIERTIYPLQEATIERIDERPTEIKIWIKKEGDKPINTRAIFLSKKEKEASITELIIHKGGKLFECTYKEGEIDRCIRVRYATREALKKALKKLDQKRVEEIYRQIKEELGAFFTTTKKEAKSSKKRAGDRYSYHFRMLDDPREEQEGQVIIAYIDRPRKGEKGIKDPQGITQIRFTDQGIIGVVTKSEEGKEWFYIYEEGKEGPQDMKILPRIIRRRRHSKKKKR